MNNSFKYILQKAITVIVSILLLHSGTSCSSENSDEPDMPDAPIPQIIVLYSPGGLGDQGYNDCILSGIQNFKKDYHRDVEIYQYSPGSLEQAERLLSDWLSLPGSNIPALLVAASNEYEPLAAKLLATKPLTPNKRFLLFETENLNKLPVTTFRLSMYGASYLAGVTAAACLEDSNKDAIIVLAHPNDEIIAKAGAGFHDGFKAAGGSNVDSEYLADDWSGYISAPLAYRRMKQWSEKYGFIFPVAGGSNQGVYRYTRENNDAPLTVGMDIDQSGLSRNITGSVIKRIDRVAYNYMETWLKTGELPESAVYGLESGYVDWLLSPYHSEYQPLVESARAEAIKKEEAEL